MTGFGYGEDPEGVEEETQEQTVPVMEPLYEEIDEKCDHINCKNDSEERSRICSECDPVMISGHPDECSYCGSSVTD